MSRIRSGSIRSNSNYQTVLARISRGKCLPIIGPEINSRFLLDAAGFADYVNYPFPSDRDNLAKVTQYLSTQDDGYNNRNHGEEFMTYMKNVLLDYLRGGLFPLHDDNFTESIEAKLDDLTISQILAQLGWEQLLSLQEINIYLILASLPLPIYLTSNYHNLMEIALRQAGKRPRSDYCRWNVSLKNAPSTLEAEYHATPDEPLVFHLYGLDDHPSSLVLSEDDFSDYLLDVVRNLGGASDSVPHRIRQAFVDSSGLYLGFQLESQAFKTLSQTMVGDRALKQTSFVQVEINRSREDIDQIKAYFKRLLSSRHDLDVYWGTPEQFIHELFVRWQEYAQPSNEKQVAIKSLRSATRKQPPHKMETAKSVPLTRQTNPYVGPRTFQEPERDRFFGREREIRELSSLVISQRLVLLYGQSGAGKSSLINAGLIPQLRAEGCRVLPVGRVSGKLPPGIGDVDNIFVFNLLLSLDQYGRDPARVTRMSLCDFLTSQLAIDQQPFDQPDKGEPEQTQLPETPHVLIVDQFEEIFTTHLNHWSERAELFRQLVQAMEDNPLLWVLLSIREEYVAKLDAYARFVPENFQARFYLQPMTYEAAIKAMQQPLQHSEHLLSPDVVKALVNNLRQIRLPGHANPQLGEFINPVQIQTTGFALWESIRDLPAGTVTLKDLPGLSDLADNALTSFYEKTIANIVHQTAIPEQELREWFDHGLITASRTRGMVRRGEKETSGLTNHAVDILMNSYLIRSDMRAGSIWYELAHDRLIEPILQANQAWRATHLDEESGFFNKLWRKLRIR